MKPTDALVDVRRNLHERLIGRVDARQLDAMPRAERRLRVREEALSLLREQGHMLPQNALADVVNAVSDAVVGMGPIEFLLKDPEITEVMVNGPDDVYVERKGRIERVADRLFEGEEAVLHVIERIPGPTGTAGSCRCYRSGLGGSPPSLLGRGSSTGLDRPPRDLWLPWPHGRTDACLRVRTTMARTTQHTSGAVRVRRRLPGRGVQAALLLELPPCRQEVG